MSNAAMILVIDDEPQIRRLLDGTLSRAGYRVAEAGSGRQVPSPNRASSVPTPRRFLR